MSKGVWCFAVRVRCSAAERGHRKQVRPPPRAAMAAVVVDLGSHSITAGLAQCFLGDDQPHVVRASPCVYDCTLQAILTCAVLWQPVLLTTRLQYYVAKQSVKGYGTTVVDVRPPSR